MRHKCLVHDPSEELMPALGRPTDVNLNPFAKSFPGLDLHQELSKVYDPMAMATSLIEMDDKFPQFSRSSRTILAAFIENTKNLQELQACIHMTPGQTEAFLKSTSAEGVLTATNPKGADIFLGIIRNSLAFLRYMRDPAPGAAFSLREWARNDNDKRWVWLPIRADQRPLLRPFATLIFDLVAMETLTLPPSADRNLWLWLEEFPVLPRLSALMDFVTNGRKHGGRWALTIQDFSQLISIYGPEDAETLAQNCSTWVALRSNSPRTAQMVCEAIGRYEEVEKSKILSSSPGETRDGVAYRATRVVRDAVLPAEIQALPNLEAFLLLHGPYPRARIKISYKAWPQAVPAFELDPKINMPPLPPNADAQILEPSSQSDALLAQPGKGPNIKPAVSKFLEKLKN